MTRDKGHAKRSKRSDVGLTHAFRPDRLAPVRLRPILLLLAAAGALYGVGAWAHNEVDKALQVTIREDLTSGSLASMPSRSRACPRIPTNALRAPARCSQRLANSPARSRPPEPPQRADAWWKEHLNPAPPAAG